MSIKLDPDQARHFVGPDLGLNCLQRLSADDTRRQRVKATNHYDETAINCKSKTQFSQENFKNHDLHKILYSTNISIQSQILIYTFTICGVLHIVFLQSTFFPLKIAYKIFLDGSCHIQPSTRCKDFTWPFFISQPK